MSLSIVGWCAGAALVLMLAWIIWRKHSSRQRPGRLIKSSCVLNPEFLQQQDGWPAAVIETLPASANVRHVTAEVTAEFFAAELPHVYRTGQARPSDFYLVESDLAGLRRTVVFAIQSSILECCARGDLPAGYPTLPNFLTVTLHIQT